jgi:uncharacterized protein (TIGR02217 family)
MAFWLARQRNGQHTDYIQRFDPRFWTIDFPRPMMASVVSTAPDALRIDAEFHHANALAGLIWWSEDMLDHPLLAYVTDRDYSRTTLRFRWRSSGVMPLDAVHGPTLTIEGKDAAGQPRSWFVRLWNYAAGTPEDAVITLPFSSLSGGWTVEGNPDPVNPWAIDRMFVSLVPQGHDPASSALLPQRVNGWVEMTGIVCEGDRPLLEIGDVLLPAHGVRMATAYDDGYNQTPARLLRTIRGLGYRDEILHYVGMSHFFRLDRQADGGLLAAPDGSFCTPVAMWHSSLLDQCAQHGYAAILSFSCELFAEHCPQGWMQRAHDGTPALTGWVPPSALLSPPNAQVATFLHGVAEQLAAMQVTAGLPVRLQIGEPWWWVNGAHAPCIYDPAMAALIPPGTPPITDMRASLDQAQKDALTQAGSRLGQLTHGIREAIKLAHGAAAEVFLLLFTPTILNPDYPDMPLLNLPAVWRDSPFDRLQLEDYDWLTAGAEALRKGGYARMDDLLEYPLALQDYMAGFVLRPEDAEEFWLRIDAGLDEAAARGVPRLYVWALPQVCRDGYTRLAPSMPGDDDEEQDMQAFDDVLYPLALGRDAGVSPEFSTAIVLTASGHERRNSQWSDARLRFDVGPGIRSEQELGVLLQFFRARRGAARGFRLSDPFDFSSNGMTGAPTMMDQPIGTGDGLAATFQLTKAYGPQPEPQIRPITRPRAGTILVSIDGAATGDWTLEAGGRLVFASAPPAGALIRAGFLFDVPVRFAEDRLDITGAAFAAGEAPSVPLVEIREAL